MTIKVRMVRQEEVGKMWPDVEPLLAPAIVLCRGETSVERVRSDLESGERKLLTVTDNEALIAAITLSMVFFPEKKICQISFAGGKRIEDWAKQGLPTVEKIAKEAGADAIYIQGRRGWLRMFKEYGFSEYATLVGKEL